MKLRIKGNSLRLRITPSEMSRLLATGRIDETIHFAAAPGAHLTYALEHAPHPDLMRLRYEPQEVAVIVSTDAARHWQSGDEVGLYAAIPTGSTVLELAVEKDFACLDKTEAENADTFPNPNQGTAC